MPIFETIQSIDELSSGDQTYLLELLEAAFPPSELPAREKLLKMMRRDDFHALVLRDEASCANPAGILTWHELPTCIYIAFLAVDAMLRGQGLGGALLDRFTETHVSDIVLEAEALDTSMAQRRLGFYRRHGFHASGKLHIPPAATAGYEAVPYHLLSFGQALDNDATERIIEQVDAIEELSA